MDVSLSAVKALAIFRLILESEEPKTIEEVSSAFGYPRTVTLRMLNTLIEQGFVMRSPETGRFTVSPLMQHSLMKGLTQSPLLSRVNYLLREVASRTGDSAVFMVRQGHHALVMDRVMGTATVRISASEPGMVLPLHCGAAPSVLLAHAPESEIEEYLSKPLEKRTGATVTDPMLLRERIKAIRKEGYAIGDQDLFEHLISVGAPVFDARGDFAGAISVGGITQNFTPERVRDVTGILLEVLRS